MQPETLFLSVRPRYAERILEGTKTVELRRVRPTASQGQRVLIYSSSPTMAVLATTTVERIDWGSVDEVWRRVRRSAGLSRHDYLDYFRGAERASAIWLGSVMAFETPVALRELRERWPWFRPPQSYCFVQATLSEPGGLEALAPRTPTHAANAFPNLLTGPSP
jgi:predicted transcriptional regulator